MFTVAAFCHNDGRITSSRITTHDKDKCSGRACVIHNPSDHHMRDWLLNWRDDIKVMERICEHGVGHPDPDHLAYVKGPGMHGCDGCCDASVSCGFLARNPMRFRKDTDDSDA
jgi:hypothetical protein